MPEGSSARGWEWTEEQRDSIKPWYGPLDRSYREVKKTVDGVRRTLPDFALDAESSARAFMEAAGCLLKLDPRRKGRKWLHMPYTAVAAEVERAKRLHHEFTQSFLSRKDFRDAVKGINKAAKDSLDEIVTKNLLD